MYLPGVVIQLESHVKIQFKYSSESGQLFSEEPSRGFHLSASYISLRVQGKFWKCQSIDCITRDISTTLAKVHQARDYFHLPPSLRVDTQQMDSFQKY